MTIAVTAATGQLGGAIIRALGTSATGEPVLGIARNPARGEGLGVDIRPGDYDNRGQLEAALGGVDTLLLVSGMDAPDRRVEQHRNVINAAIAAGVEKLVYTSVQGPDHGTAFSPIIRSNRQTEEDIRSSGLAWVIGRNGLYIEPDVEYIETYKERGGISNCAGDRKCGYTTRAELAWAYARLLSDPAHHGRTYNLHGEPITQAELADHLNGAFGTELVYRPMSVDEYREDRVGELGEFMGNIIVGIYEGIGNGAMDNPSDYAVAAGRPHQTWQDYFAQIKARRASR